MHIAHQITNTEHAIEFKLHVKHLFTQSVQIFGSF